VEDYCWRFNMPWSPNMSTWYLLALISRRFYCEFQTTTAERPTSLHWGLSTDAWNQDVAVACRLVDALWPVVISCRCVDARTKAPSWCRVDQRAISGTHNVRVRSISPSLCFSLSLSLSLCFRTRLARGTPVLTSSLDRKRDRHPLQLRNDWSAPLRGSFYNRRRVTASR